MFDIGFLELIIVAVIGLLVLGPERLPKAAQTVGRWVGRARRMVTQFSQEVDRQLEVEELREQLKKQGDSYDIENDIRNIQSTVKDALDEAKAETQIIENSILDEYEPLPREEDAKQNAIANQPAQANNEDIKHVDEKPKS